MGIGKESSRKPDEIRCECCGSNNLKEDYEVGEVVCNDCGLVDSGKLLDPAGHSRFGEDAHNTKSSELGSNIGKGRGPRSIRRTAKKNKPKNPKKKPKKTKLEGKLKKKLEPKQKKKLEGKLKKKLELKLKLKPWKVKTGHPKGKESKKMQLGIGKNCAKKQM